MWVALSEFGLNYFSQAGIKRSILATRDQLQLIPQFVLPSLVLPAIEVSKRS